VSHLGEPLIIEAALNGGTPKSRNPNVPSAPDEVVEQALAVLDAGAAIVHTHIDRPKLAGEEAAERYMEAYRPILRRRPDAILYGTIGPGGSFETSFSHFAGLARGGARMGTFDPGPVNLGDQADNGLPRTSILYGNSFKDIAGLVELYRDTKLGPSFAIYEPGWLRTVLAYERAGQLPAGSLVKLYFGGRYNIFDGRPGNITFGLPPTAKALDAYLEMLEGSALPWSVAAFGDCVVSTGLAGLAIRRGGHVRVGLEDYGGEDRPSNLALVEQVVELACKAGRPIATPAEAARLLKLPARG
jgi:3-keto-5-aminohexanoate cleavage enzyme